MQSQNTIKPAKLTSFFVSIIIILDSLSALAFGLFCFVIAGISDPVNPTPGAKDAVFLWAGIVILLACTYIILCFISLIFWQNGKRNWIYSILGLGLMHLAVSSYLFSFRDEFDFFAYLLYGSLIINLLLLIIVIVGEIKSKLLSKMAGPNSGL